MGNQALKNHRLWLFFLILVWVTASAPAVKAEAKGKKGQEGEIPLRITASRLEADQKNGVIVFSGQVKAQQGDAILYADKLQVYFQSPLPASAAAPAGAAPKEKPGPSPLGDLGGEKITKIVARGQVRFVQGDRIATGQEAIYYKDREEVVLLGNPQLWRAENTLKGEKIIFNLKDNKVLVESSPQKRVEAHLYSSAPSSGGGKGSPPFGPKGLKGRQP
jgi:lipopolysaccharide export system protein LptA